MAEALPKSKKTKEDGCFVSLIKGIGCFFFSFIFVSILLVIFGYYFIYPVMVGVSADPKLPEFDGPSEHDFWSLQEKHLNIKDKTNEEIHWDLNHGEFNALLSSIRVPPVSLFCLSKVRHSYKDKELRYYLIGSGFLLKKFVISFVVANDSKNYFPSEIRLNNWKVPGDSWYEKKVKNLISDIAIVDKSSLLTKIISGEIKPEFNDI